jgi:heterodisulfide reductase subunit C
MANTMRIRVSSGTVHNKWVDKISELSDQNLLSCYQCGKCSAGCPVVGAMDVLPNQVIRLVQLGLEEELVKSKTPWICASCFMCHARCPKGVDIAKVMEAIRQVILRTRVDWVKLEELSQDVISEAPQMGIVAGLRKYTS